MVAADVLYNYRDLKILVMAPTRPLCLQHHETFKRIIRLGNRYFALLTGSIPHPVRKAIWNGEQRIIFATPQTVRNDILSGILNMSQFGLVVFDECHRAVKEYAYTEIANKYVKDSAYPLILGMTASPGSSIERIRMVCESLYIEHVEFRSEQDEDVRQYINEVKIEWKLAEIPESYKELRKTLLERLQEKVSWLRERGYLKSERITKKALVELGDELRFNMQMSIDEEKERFIPAIVHQSSALTLYHMIELLESQGIKPLLSFIERSISEKKSIGKKALESIYSIAKEKESIEHPKVETLLSVLREQFSLKKDSRVIVFTQYRDTASYLLGKLSSLDFIRAERFVGQSSRQGDKGLSQEEQYRIINDLKKNYINTIVATSIAEEGLDIPQVDLVVFYEPVPSEIRYIQRRGRTGRNAPGKVVILAAKDTIDTLYMRVSSEKVEKMREIASRLNLMLRPILRVREKPEPRMMQLSEIERLQTHHEELEDIYLRTQREIERAKRAAYIKLLKNGRTSTDELVNELISEGFSSNVAHSAIEQLEKKKYVVAGSGQEQIPYKEIYGTRKMKITIERVMQGMAVVLVNDKWRARLLPENFYGPRELIRKGSTFYALCSLYRDSDALCVNVRHVLGKA